MGSMPVSIPVSGGSMPVSGGSMPISGGSMPVSGGSTGCGGSVGSSCSMNSMPQTKVIIMIVFKEQILYY